MKGIEVGAEGTTGLITYMRNGFAARGAGGDRRGARVDRQAVGSQVPARVAECVQGQRKPRRMRTKRFGLPMRRVRQSRLRATLPKEQLKLYRLIWQGFVASQMTPAIFDVTTAKIAAVSSQTGKTYDFRLSGSVVRFDGFLKVYEVLEDQKGRRRRIGQQAAQPGQRESGWSWKSWIANSTSRSRLRATTKLRW